MDVEKENSEVPPKYTVDNIIDEKSYVNGNVTRSLDRNMTLTER